MATERCAAALRISFDLQGLFEKLRQVGQNCGIRHHQCRARPPSRRLERVRSFVREGNDGDVGGCWILFQSGDGRTDVGPAGTQIHNHKHRSFAASVVTQSARVCNRRDSIVQVLQPVHQLAAGHQVFIQN